MAEGCWGCSPQDAQAAARSAQPPTEEAHATVPQRAVSQLQPGQARVLRQQRCQLRAAALGQPAPLQPVGEHGERRLSTPHLSWPLTCPPKLRDDTQLSSDKQGPASPRPLAGVPGEQQGSTNPLTHCPVLWVPPAPAQMPALLWAPRASLTGAAAGRCPGAAEPGRAGGWDRAAPPAAARRGHWDVLRLWRLQSCRGTEPRGTGSPRRGWEFPAPAHKPSHPEQSLRCTGGLLRRDLCAFGDVKDLEHCCWIQLGEGKSQGALNIPAPGISLCEGEWEQEGRVTAGHRWAWPGGAKKLQHHRFHRGQQMDEPTCSLFFPRSHNSSAEELNTQGKAKLVFRGEELNHPLGQRKRNPCHLGSFK